MAVSFVVVIVLFPQSNQFGMKMFSLCNKKVLSARLIWRLHYFNMLWTPNHCVTCQL